MPRPDRFPFRFQPSRIARRIPRCACVVGPTMVETRRSYFDLMFETFAESRVGRVRHVMRRAIEPARQGLKYVLEFFVNRIGGPKTSLDKFGIEDGSLDDARDQAKSIMRNVKFDGATANLCIIRTKNGAIVGEIRPDPPRS